MRLIEFYKDGRITPGIRTQEGIIDLRRHFPDIPDIGEAFFEDGWLARIAGFTAPVESISPRLASPVPRPSKIICLGKNYAEHAKEGGFDSPERPLIFCKTLNTVNGPFDDIRLPVGSGNIDWEVELAVVIGRRGRGIAAADAADYIAGYMVMNDVSGREAQFADSQWFRGKSFDTFAPMGPELVTADELTDVGNLRIACRVNGEIMQDGNTRDLVFDIPTIIENISQDITLWPGDVISTGTPAGVGIFRDPPIILKAGDVVECTVEGIGTIRNRVVAG